MGCGWIAPPPPGLTDFKKPGLNRVNHLDCRFHHSPMHCFLLSVSLFDNSDLIELISINFVKSILQCLISTSSQNALLHNPSHGSIISIIIVSKTIS